MPLTKLYVSKNYVIGHSPATINCDIIKKKITIIREYIFYAVLTAHSLSQCNSHRPNTLCTVNQS